MLLCSAGGSNQKGRNIAGLRSEDGKDGALHKTHCKAVGVEQVPREMVLAAEEVPGEVQ